MSADIILLRVIRIERGNVDLANQRLLCSSDLSRVVEIRQVKMERTWRKIRERLDGGKGGDHG